MATTLTKHIGTAYPAGRDYPGPVELEAAMPASLVAADEIWDCIFHNDGEIVLPSADTPVIFNATTDSTRYIHLRCAPGESWIENTDVATDPIRRDISKGVAFRNPSHRGGCLSLRSTKIVCQGFQTHSGWWSIDMDGTAGLEGLVEDCLGQTTNNQTGMGIHGLATMRNCYQIITGGSGQLFSTGKGGGGFSILRNCTGIRAGGTAAMGVGCDPSNPHSSIQNCVFVNVTATFGTSLDSSTQGVISHNASTTTIHLGTDKVESIVASDCFENTSSTTLYDARLKATATALFDAGTTLADFSDDAFGVTRPQGSLWDIGAQEFTTAGGAPAFTNPYTLLGVGRGA